MHAPTDSVRVVLFDHRDPEKFLVITESDDKGNWKLPGGKFEGNETPVGAAARELTEELGLTDQQVTAQMAAELINNDGVSKRYIFFASIDPALAKPSHEIDQLQWFTVATLPDCGNREHILSAMAVARSKTT